MHGDSIFPPVPSVGFFLAKLSDHKWIVNCSGVTCKLSDTPEQPSTKPNTKSVMESWKVNQKPTIHFVARSSCGLLLLRTSSNWVVWHSTSFSNPIRPAACQCHLPAPLVMAPAPAPMWGWDWLSTDQHIAQHHLVTMHQSMLNSWKHYEPTTSLQNNPKQKGGITCQIHKTIPDSPLWDNQLRTLGWTNLVGEPDRSRGPFVPTYSRLCLDLHGAAKSTARLNLYSSATRVELCLMFEVIVQINPKIFPGYHIIFWLKYMIPKHTVSGLY